jgi:hypothetical protein
MCSNRAITVAAVVLGLCVPGRTAPASSIVQKINFDIASHGTNYTPYAQFNPALGPLHEVDIAISGGASSDYYSFQNHALVTVDFTATVGVQVGAAMNNVVIESTFAVSLRSGETNVNLGNAGGVYTATGSYTAASSNLAYWIGTRTLNPDIVSLFSFARVSDPRIFVQPAGLGAATGGTETITYVYGLVTPEPASAVMLGLGLVAVAGMACNVGN